VSALQKKMYRKSIANVGCERLVVGVSCGGCRLLGSNGVGCCSKQCGPKTNIKGLMGCRRFEKNRTVVSELYAYRGTGAMSCVGETVALEGSTERERGSEACLCR